MVKAKDEEKAIARKLRQQGWSYGEIAKELGVSKGSVSGWCSDIEIDKEQEAAIHHRKQQWGDKNKGAKINKQRGIEQRKLYQEAGRQKAREKSKLHLIGCMLYWAEGAKTRRNELVFANSDPIMIDVFMRFLREELLQMNEVMKVQIHCYALSLEELQAIEAYWLELLQLSAEALYPSQVLKGSDKRHNRLENGVCSIRIQSTRLVQHIFGAIQEYGGFVNEEWLY
jgi:predicted transcriptional regulator